MASALQYKCEVDIEATFGDGGSSFIALPLTNDSLPKKRNEIDRPPVYSGSLAQQKSYVLQPYYEIPVKFYLKGSGTAGTAPELSELLRAFGLQEVDGVSDVVYKVRDTGHESCALKFNRAGIQTLVPGVRGMELRIPFVGGKKILCEGTMWGLYSAPTAVAFSAPTFTDVAVIPPTVASMVLTIGGNTHSIDELNLTIRNTLELEPNINAGNYGIGDFSVGMREYKIEAYIQRDAASDIEYWTNWLASTEVALASSGVGAAGNKVAISGSNLQFEDIEEVYRYMKNYYRITLAVNYNATAASEFSLTLT